ncbi:MAG: transposase zinc-binding domain-containing protein [Desulfobacterales bacterium]|nr:transposase zinc-binding domain-containing protein [Desulfobacterales bacterium]
MLNQCPSRIDFGVYESRNPQASHYFRCVEAHFEQLEGLWDDRYADRYGFWRPYVKEVIFRYLDCGDLHFGFARVKCKDCGHEYLLPFSCKRRHFCPSCHQKRVIEFGEWLCEDVLKYVPHRQWVFSIPKRLRIYFMFDRSLLTKLSRCAWKVLNLYLTQAVPYDDAKAGAAVAVQSFGDFQNFHPHLHVLATDGCFYNDGAFMVCPPPKTADLEALFRHEVFRMLKAEGKITDSVIENMMNWRHSGFNVYCGNAIWPHNDEGLENLARYIIRASFSQERMTYIPANDSSDGAKVVYESKDGKTSKTFEAVDWLAQLVTHIPNRGEQMVRYYGYYSNRSRGDRKKQGKDDQVPALIQSAISPKEFRKNWARLIQKIYNVDPLLCPKCLGVMKIISFIEDKDVIEKILRHLGLWKTRNHDPPFKSAAHIPELTYDDSYSQLPPSDYWLQ